MGRTASCSRPIWKQKVDHVGRVEPVIVEGFIAFLDSLAVLLLEVVRPHRVLSIDVREAVFLREVPRAEHSACLIEHIGIGGERSDGATYIERRLGREKVRVLLSDW